MPTLLLILTTTLVAQTTPVEAAKPMPSASALIDEMLEEATQAGAWDDWIGSYHATLIMGALYDCGRADEAKRLAYNCEDEIDRSLYLMNYAEVVTEREGASPEFERLISSEVADNTDDLLGQAIAVMVSRGKLAEAEQLFDRLGRPVDHGDGITGVRSDPWTKVSSGSMLARALVDAGERERAKRLVHGLLETLSRWKNTCQFPRRLDELLPLAIELGQTDALEKLLMAVEAEATRADATHYLPQWFVCSGRWWAAHGDLEKARRDFEKAKRCVIAREEAMDSDDYIELASQARFAGVTDLADEWTNSALLRIQEKPFDENRQLLRVIYNTCIDGDQQGAEIYLAKITMPYERISGRITIAELLIRNGDRKAAKSYLADAVTELENVTDQELDSEGEHNERGYLLQELAKLHHQLNNDQAADELIQQAAQLVPDDDMSLWSLASAQIAVGRFEDAYATVHRISRDTDNEFQENLRLNALIELAATVAEREAATRRE